VTYKVKVVLILGFHVSIFLVQQYPELIVLYKLLLGARYTGKWGRTKAKVLPEDRDVTVITTELPPG